MTQINPERTIAVQQLIQDFQWAARAFKFTDLEKLVVKTWANMESWEGSFEEFCLKHQALTVEGKTTTANGVDKDGNPVQMPFAYPFFCAIKFAIEKVVEKEDWEKAHTVDFGDPKSFENIMDEAPISGMEAMMRGLHSYLQENPKAHKASRLFKTMEVKLAEKQNAGQATSTVPSGIGAQAPAGVQVPSGRPEGK